MELEILVSRFAMVLQIVGWTSLATCKLSRDHQIAANGEIALLASLCGMGTVTLVAAWLLTSAALTTGFTLAVIMVALISRPLVEPQAEPSTLLRDSAR